MPKMNKLEEFNQKALDNDMSYGKYQMQETCRKLRKHELKQEHIETPEERCARLYYETRNKTTGVYGDLPRKGKKNKDE